MRTPRLPLLIILFLTVCALVTDLPENVPLKLALGPIQINRVISPPRFFIPFTGIDRQIKTHLGLDLLGGTQLVLEADMNGVPVGSHDQALESAREVIERRVNFFGVSEPVVQSAKVGESRRIIVELPGIADINQALATLGQTARLEFRQLNPEATGSQLLATVQNTKSVDISGADLKQAEVSFDQTTGEPVVSFEMTAAGAKKFAEVSSRLVGQPLAIFLDDLPVSVPVIKTPITDGRGIISGEFTRENARTLALQLSAGALPTPIKVIEQRNIGASLGSLSVAKSIRAGAIGLTLVALFMIFYYGRLGLIADLALVVYGLVTYALFRLIPVTLTLPGITGFILSIGMAVDSNILIFERMKEEVRKGRSWYIAMELGFGRAWDSIRDANFTTLLTAFILYNPFNWSFFPSSGMVRGFALTLALGVLVSLFTGIVVSRNLIRAFYRPRRKATDGEPTKTI